MTKLALTIPEAVAMSGIGRSSLYEVFKAGGIKPRKHGKRTLVMVADLENYLKSLPVAL
jgi:predicted DNA-binding transcriptional regulator AlpA